MIGKLWAAISGNLWLYLAGAFAIAFGGLFVAFMLRGAQLDTARADLKVVKSEVDQAKRTIAGYQDAVRQCNAATKALEQASAEKGAATDKALLQAQQEARRYQESNKRRAVLLAGPTPAGAGCREAVADLRRGLK